MRLTNHFPLATSLVSTPPFLMLISSLLLSETSGKCGSQFPNAYCIYIERAFLEASRPPQSKEMPSNAFLKQEMRLN